METALSRPPRRLVHARVTRAGHKDGTYTQLLQAQEGRCAICRRSPDDIAAATNKPVRRLDIDHDHKTLAIRGLLCRGCNLRLRRGLTSQWLEAASVYLKGAA